MKLKAPAFVTRLSASLKRKPARRRPHQALHAATASRRMSQAMDDEIDDEPTTRLSSAFFVVLILHLVAVGGIWAFNSIKAHRRGYGESGTPATKSAPAQAGADAKSQTAAPPAAPTLADAKPPAAQTAGPAATTVKPAGTFYQVKTNDTLTKIATSLGVSVADLQAANDAKEIAVLHPGQVLNVPTKKAAEAPASSGVQKKAESTPAQKKTETASAKSAPERSHKVMKGDTLSYIAKRYGTSVEDLVKFNKIKDPKRLQLGDTLKIPAK